MRAKRKPRESTGTLSPDFVRKVRRAFEARRAIPTDDQLAAEGQCSRTTIRLIGSRLRYAHVPDEPSG